MFFNVNINQSRSELFDNLSDLLSLALIYRRAITQNYKQGQKKHFYVKKKKKKKKRNVQFLYDLKLYDSFHYKESH